MVFAQEKLADVWDETASLRTSHHDEVGALRDAPLQPSKDTYLAMERAGCTAFYTARDKVGRLCGYNLLLRMRHHHYPSTVWAMDDVLYVEPAERRGLAAIEFIKHADMDLCLSGVDFVTRRVTPRRDYSKVLLREGYELLETVYVRRLGA